MPTTYTEYMNNLTQQELYKGLVACGLFCDKLPPVFTSEEFFAYCSMNKIVFSDEPKQYISFSNMRHTNVPRQFGIPNPFAYQRLCRCLADNWGRIQTHFAQNTKNQTHKVSRVHVRKLSGTESIFEMNYNNWRIDGSPEPDLLIGKRYLAKADIATCFPSIYSHALAWALVGKDIAKRTWRQKKKWYNRIDHFTQQIKDGETHGLLIGPHASNVLSEIILICIDNELVRQNWKYTRHIDDYSCYVTNYVEGQKFLTELNKHLRNFGLLLNPKKTDIFELPQASAEQWVRQLNSSANFPSPLQMNYLHVRSYIDSAIDLMQSNKNNAAILNYAIKVLRHKNLTDNAKQCCIKAFLHLAFIYPYLVPLLENNIFTPFAVKENDIEFFAKMLFIESLTQQNYESVYYTIYYAIRWDFKLDGLTAEKAIDTQDCLVMLFAYKYFEKFADNQSTKKLKDHAESLKDKDFESNWLFVYEVLPESKLSGDWKPMKRAGISFLML